MSKLILNKWFYLGFGLGILLFVLASHFVDRLNRPICFDCTEKFGLPFRYLETGGQAFSSRYLWDGVFLDLFCAVIVGTILGLVFSKISAYFSKLRSFN